MARSSSLVFPFFALVLLPLTAGCGEASSGQAQSPDQTSSQSSDLRFDPCRPLVLVVQDGATPEEAAGVEAAARAWNDAAGAQVTVASAGSVTTAAPQVPVSFQRAATPSHGFFDPVAGRVLINEDLAGHPLAVTIAHEVGHAFGLVHVTGRPSVMNPGNLDVDPNTGDVGALATLWGACSGGSQ
ncbi:MAG TPA: hypothetical protein VHK47_09950 [Polyangia bacterium]|jgi:hypothetical protein|nr:hypothetical protein [Polyangia bacterium]